MLFLPNGWIRSSSNAFGRAECEKKRSWRLLVSRGAGRLDSVVVSDGVVSSISMASDGMTSSVSMVSSTGSLSVLPFEDVAWRLALEEVVDNDLKPSGFGLLAVVADVRLA